MLIATPQPRRPSSLHSLAKVTKAPASGTEAEIDLNHAYCGNHLAQHEMLSDFLGSFISLAAATRPGLGGSHFQLSILPLCLHVKLKAKHLSAAASSHFDPPALLISASSDAPKDNTIGVTTPHFLVDNFFGEALQRELLGILVLIPQILQTLQD